MGAAGTTGAADAHRTARLEDILTPDAVMATGTLNDPAGKDLQLSFWSSIIGVSECSACHQSSVFHSVCHFHIDSVIHYLHYCLSDHPLGFLTWIRIIHIYLFIVHGSAFVFDWTVAWRTAVRTASWGILKEPSVQTITWYKYTSNFFTTHPVRPHT